MLDRYNPILSELQKLDPLAHIAGGAIRDTLLERPIKDIDLFLGDYGIDKAAALLRSEFGFVKVGEWKQYLAFSDPRISRLAKFEKADEETPIALIGLTEWNEGYGRSVSSIEDNLGRFDFGICMAAWNGSDVITMPEYRRDLEAKTFTLCRADNEAQFNYSMKRFEKITADRYAGWRLVVPKAFEDYAKERALKQTHYYDRDNEEWRPHGWGLGPQELHPKAR
jgi:hypothetical protein